MIHSKVVDEISLNFPELFIKRKYVKIRFKNRRPPYYILGFIFYGVSRTKTDLHNKYIVNFKFG